MELKEKIINEIKKIYDPEIPVNIYELGLIYDIKIDKSIAKEACMEKRIQYTVADAKSYEIGRASCRERV